MKTHTKHIQREASFMRSIRRRFASMLVVCVSALLTLPAALAVSFSNVPLQSGSAYPPADLMLVIDDSGSMAGDKMPDNPAAVSPVDISDLAYPRNGLSYNPNTTYKPWIKADGTRQTGGTSYTSVSDSDTNVATAVTSTSTTSLANTLQIYYAPKLLDASGNPSGDMSNSGNYYYYQIVNGTDVQRSSTYGATVRTTVSPPDQYPSGFPKTGLSATTGTYGAFVQTYSFTLPAGVDTLDIATSGGSESKNGVDLYVRRGSAPTTGTYDCRSNGSNNNEDCSFNSPTADTWYVYLRDGSGSGNQYSGVRLDITFSYNSYYTTNRCDGDTTKTSGNTWINCTSNLPNSSRTLAQELTNYATWYSYYRTRIKMAKGGISEAFSQIGTNVRVGFNTIHNASPMNIPVGTDNGLFRDLTTPTATTNRTTFYNRIYAAVASGYTPNRTGLARAGQYYQNATSAGPWGPETGSSQISCRQAFTIMTTDGYWNNNSDSSSILTAIGDDDSIAGSAITSADGTQTYTYAPTNPYKDNQTAKAYTSSGTITQKTLADVAMYYWKNDLVPTLANNVPASATDPAFWQHMVTFGVSLGADGTLNPTTDLPAITAGSKKWPAVTSSSSGGDGTNIDDLWHATVNGRGSFVVATDPTKFAEALQNALSLIAARRGSASNVATNSTSFQSDTRVFQARYWSGRWTGELAAYSATSAGVATEPVWQASQLIPTTRTILTWNDAGTGGATFPTPNQLTALDQSSRPLTPVSSANNAAYIKGTATLETRNGGTLRDRQIVVRSGGVDVISPTVLGDIADSTPIFVQELQTLFVGSNDGMLHAFDAVTGVEKFAYVPGGIDLTQLKTLSDPAYTHSYFVDGPVSVSTTKQTPGHNYLVGALGRGGKGVFGLEVSTPSAFTTSNVLWESSKTDIHMGNVLGEPLVVTLNDGSKGVVVSNGINSTNGDAELYILNIATGAVLSRLDTGVGSDNGLFAPRGWDKDGNGTVDYVYAGDLKGNLWKFDLTGSTTASWKVALAGSPLFVAKDASNNRQPITAGLALALEPITGKRWVFIGTGQFLNASDVGNTNVQSMYGVVDDDTAAVTGRTSAGDGDLQKRSIIAIGTEANKSVRAFEAASDLNIAAKGWYVDLLTPPSATAEGERIVSNPRVFGTVLVTASLIPPTDNTCDAGGSGYINALNAFTGASLDAAFFNVNANSTAGVQNFSDDVLTVGGVTVPVGSVDLGLGMPTLPTLIDKLLVAGGSTGAIGYVTINPQNAGARRISWREIRKD